MILSITGNTTVNYRYNTVSHETDTGKLQEILLSITGNDTVNYRIKTVKAIGMQRYWLDY